VSINELKRAAGYRAADDYIRDGMGIGVGSGSTAYYATLRIAERLREGTLRDILAIPTSEDTARIAREQGIPLTTLEEHPRIAVTIDGADEVDPEQNVIKGLGGFLLREKIVAFATDYEIMVVDDSKLVQHLGEKAPVPVEVIRFGWQNTCAALERTGARPQMRQRSGAPYITDEGNYILDCIYDRIASPQELAAALKAIPGVVEHGLFLGMVHCTVIAAPQGVRVVER